MTFAIPTVLNPKMILFAKKKRKSENIDEMKFSLIKYISKDGMMIDNGDQST